MHNYGGQSTIGKFVYICRLIFFNDKKKIKIHKTYFSDRFYFLSFFGKNKTKIFLFDRV